MTKKIGNYGGQAVVEGVMFGGPYNQVTAIRRRDGSIETYEIEKKQYIWVNFLKKIPLIRGIVALIESSALGAKHFQFASEKYAEDTDEDYEPAQESSSKWGMIFSVAIIGVLSFLMGKIIFTAFPAFLASFLFDSFVKNLIIQNLIEGAIKTLLLLGYLWLIIRTPMVKRLFQYHGAEHKVINAYEAGLELTVENVQKQSTLHYRCGSSFIILTIIVGIFVYSFFSYENVWDRILTRILLIPVVIGLSFEILKITNAVRNIPILSYLGYPGLWLQKLTTREPLDEQVEVAIAAFNRLQELEVQVKEKISTSSAFTRWVHS
mgnify:CR=1 FL=1